MEDEIVLVFAKSAHVLVYTRRKTLLRLHTNSSLHALFVVGMMSTEAVHNCTPMCMRPTSLARLAGEMRAEPEAEALISHTVAACHLQNSTRKAGLRTRAANLGDMLSGSEEDDDIESKPLSDVVPIMSGRLVCNVAMTRERATQILHRP